ncbi:nucleotidyl transferase AbiEii/AbiGii toxin family protein [Bacteroides oleiciplenus]|uniref:nucleotidyl transferase AbiEii/AbiGii toxin family protein n=1 Tax=Bacteroides oleiciplenus TaxID=626931 RepID=UPI00216B0E18|nr:nucleotidyl transferase AbiEii/AbiGii toxin family protein [Bacteroides oleiciplenus]
MIPRRYVEDWKSQAPWPTDAQVEQDLKIARSLVEIFSNSLLKNSLAFRGGTVLHKLYLLPQVRYSVNLDLVQINSEPINPILKQIWERLSVLGTKLIVKQHIHNNTIIYRIETKMQSVINMRLKIKINTRENINVLGLKKILYEVENSWYTGKYMLTGSELEELLETKLRALYQRRKGCDLFDLYWTMAHHNIDMYRLILCNKTYMEYSVDKPLRRSSLLPTWKKKGLTRNLTSYHIETRCGIQL